MQVNDKVRLNNPDIEPTDEELHVLMLEVAENVRKKNKAANDKYFADLRQLISSKKVSANLQLSGMP